jgi:hypothetical protein
MAIEFHTSNPLDTAYTNNDECSTLLYKDELIGEFSGNILEAIAELFPRLTADQIRSYPPLSAQWQVYERITWEGTKGYRFYVSKGISKRVFGGHVIRLWGSILD